jgi:hypothetical protein
MVGYSPLATHAQDADGQHQSCTISHNKPLVAAHDVETFGTWNKQFYEVGGETAPRAAQPLSC